MPSPFPGMDPYLEGPNLWEGFHANLATEIQSQLNPYLRPKYVATLTPRVVYDEVLIARRPYTIKPDVGVWQVGESGPAYEQTAATIPPAPLVGEVAVPEPVREQRIEIRQVETGELVTAVELLSPVNKRRGHDAHRAYLRKRRDLLRTDVNLMEVDLLRIGERPPILTPLPDEPYFIFLHRGRSKGRVEIWPIPLRQPLPVVPVPLLEPDPDVPLDFNRVMQTIYDRAAYDLVIDYSQPPPWPKRFRSEDWAWMADLLQVEW